MNIGLLSDTHGFLDPKVPELFAGVEHILHAGDIGCASIITELEEVAPVTAVLGNTDDGLHFRETEAVTLAGRKFLLHHIVDVRTLAEGIRQRIAKEKPDVVMFGHTHKPFNQTIEGTLYINPGYAGKQRFNLERSVAILHCKGDNLRAEYVPL